MIERRPEIGDFQGVCWDSSICTVDDSENKNIFDV